MAALPYFTTADKDPTPFSWFGVLVVAAILLGHAIARARARRLGYDVDRLDSLVAWMLVGGFLGGHVLGDLLYFPRSVAENPWSLLYVWRTQSSLPGFVGALLGLLLWRRFRGGETSLFAWADLILSVFPISWILGRAGCALVHDHPGRSASGPFAFLAVDYPPGNLQRIPPGPHWNLGLLEMLFSVLLSAVLLLLWRRPRPVGTYVATTCLFYAPVRFLLDFLRADDVRYFGLTPGQFASVAILTVGIFALRRAASTTARSPAARATR